MSWQEAYMARFYAPERGFSDGTGEFHRLCAQYVRGRILEIGSGPSNPTSRYLASLGELHGLDPDPAVRHNDALRGSAVLEGNEFPFPDASFDAAVSNYVLEHVPAGAAHLREVARVLRPGGAYVFRTPNRLHYVALVSSLTPHWFHEAVANRLRGHGAEAPDPYPTHYVLNSRGALRRQAEAAGFDIEELRMVEKEPTYGRASRVLFLLFTAYERLVNACELGAPLRANIFGVLRKSASA